VKPAIQPPTNLTNQATQEAHSLTERPGLGGGLGGEPLCLGLLCTRALRNTGGAWG